MSRSILVFGETGQVARELSELSGGIEGDIVFAGRSKIDLIWQNGGDLIRQLAPRAVINASAYTAVDKAEAEREAAFRLNAIAVGEMAEACAILDIPFVHVSTDYVFDGEAASAYVETDPRRPMSVYGESKAEGEMLVEASGARYAILRTSWVYSAFGTNFMKTMLRLANERDTIDVVDDQQGCPTWAGDVASACLLAAERLTIGDDTLQGLFHVAGNASGSWADFAEGIFSESALRGGPTAEVKRIRTMDFPMPAKRPVNSRLSSEKFALAAGRWSAGWRERLGRCFDIMEARAR